MNNTTAPPRRMAASNPTVRRNSVDWNGLAAQGRGAPVIVPS
jgi:hypothetical protein